MILERIKEYIDFKKLAVSAFERSIGMSNASFGKSLKNGGAIGTDKLENILNIYTDINPVWLLTGKGDMLIGEKSSTSESIDVNAGNYFIEKIAQQAEEIGSLKERIKQLERTKDTSVWDAPTSTNANVG